MKAPLLFALALSLAVPTASAGTVWDYLEKYGIEPDDVGNITILAGCGDALEPICRIYCDYEHLMPDWYTKLMECVPS